MAHNAPNKLELRPRRGIWRTLWHFWPLAVWIGVVFLTIWTYKQGVVFRRMNGAVDPVQVTVSTPEEAVLESLGPNIQRGMKVKKGQILAQMQTTEIDEKLNILLEEIKADKDKRLLDLTDSLNKIGVDIAKIEADQAEGEAKLEIYEKLAEEQKTAQEALRKELGAQAVNFSIHQDAEARAEIAAINQKKPVWEKALGRLNAEYKRLEEEYKRLEMIKDDTEKLLANAGQNDRAQYTTLQNRRKRLTIVATADGTIDRIGKDPGELVKPGEGIMKIVSDTNEIIGFLPEDQIGQVMEGKKVWITPSGDRSLIWESQITFAAPRMNTVPDATSPMPNKRLHGRDIIIAFPEKAKGLLLPGQTVIIHLQSPGEIPLWDRIFHNEDKP